jgi:glycerate dehydrogenase
MARLAESVGMRIIISERKHASEVRQARTRFEDVLRQSDIVSLHCPLNDETRDLIGQSELRMMKRTALLINTARGALIAEAALIEALRSGQIAGAGIDVLREEPPRDGSPLLNLDLPNLIVTPHVAWASNEAVQTLADQVIDNIEAFVAGEPQNLLT